MLIMVIIPEHILDIVANAALHQPNLSLHMTSYQQLLKRKYKSMNYVSQDEILDCFSTKYIELFLSLRWNDESITLSEALELGKKKDNLIVFEGDPGVGKSMFAKHICKQWAEGDLLQDYDAVILLLLRDPEIQGAKSISDLLMILDDEIRESVFKEIVKSNGERVCFMLEGYDELPKQCLKQFSFFSKLKENLQKCTIVITSRPGIHHYIEKSFSYPLVVRIHGFKTDSIDQYISSTFENVKNGQELAKTLKSQLHNNPVVESIVHVPINLAIVCLIFLHLKTLPETLTELYTVLCLRLILRHIITRTPNEENTEKLTSLNYLPKGISENFFKLCFFAFKSLERKNIVFYSQDLLEVGIDEIKLCCLGLLQIAPTISVYGREKSYNFLHLTVQEFCAAWYISKLSTEEQVKYFKSYYCDEQFEMVWRFYSGITGLKDREILDLMLPYKLVKSKLTKLKMIKLMFLLHEAHNDEACKIVGDHCDGNFTDLYPEHSRFVSYSFDKHKTLLEAFSYFLIHYKGMLKRIDVSDWQFITDVELTVIVNALEKRRLLNMTSDKLILKVSVSRITSQSFSLLINLLAQQCPIDYLDVHEDFICSNRLATLTFKELLTQRSTLRVLDISGIYIKFKEAECLASCRNVLVQDLKMRWCNLSPREADKIGEMLAHNPHIVSVDLGYNYIKDEGIERIVYHLRNGSTLQCIKLCYNNITTLGINHLITSNLLQTNSSLTNLDLSHNNLKHEDVYLFLNSLNITMEYLGLYGYSFIVKAVAATQAVHNVKSIGFACYNFVDPLINTTTIQKLVIHVTNLKLHHKITEVISKYRCLEELKIYYSFIRKKDLKVLKELSVCLMKNRQKVDLELHFTLRGKVFSYVLESLIKWGAHLGSIKKIETTLPRPLVVTSSRLQEFLVKMPDTLEELTMLGLRLHDDKNTQKFDGLLQEINELRSIKGVSNSLQVNIFYGRREGFDIEPYIYRFHEDYI